VWPVPWHGSEKFFNLVCIVLSTELTKSIGKSVTIFSDSETIQVLRRFVDSNVEYSSLLDTFKETNKHKWALSKMFVLNNIKTPVCHIDYDVFLLKQQEDKEGDITCQNLEKGKNYEKVYKRVFEDFLIDANKDFLSDELKMLLDNNLYSGYNCGYLDIKNVDFCKYWTSKSIETFNMMKTFNSAFNCILPEQSMLYATSIIKNINVNTLYEVEDINSGNIDKVDKPYLNGYCHLMSSKFQMAGNRRSINIQTLNKLLNYLQKKHNSSFERLYDNSDLNYKTYLKFYEKYYC
jgi:hypothetical protein